MDYYFKMVGFICDHVTLLAYAESGSPQAVHSNEAAKPLVEHAAEFFFSTQKCDVAKQTEKSPESAFTIH